MQTRLAASTTAFAFVLAACGSTSDDFGDTSHLAAAGANTTGGSGNPAAGMSGAERAGTTGASGQSATSGGAPSTGGSSGTAGGPSNSGGSEHGAGRSGMDSGAGGMPSGAGGTGSGGGGRANAAGGAGAACGGDGNCAGGASARGGRGGRAMGGGGAGGAGNASTAGAGAVMGMAGGGACPASGHVSYTLTKAANPSSDQQQAYDLITPAMDKAVQYYNCYTNITKADTVTYDASVPTADGNINGSIRFGGTDYMEYITAMHEISHTVGVGTAPKWASIVVNGIFTGEKATAQLRAITGNASDQLNADTQHFWPYGLNYTSEVKSEADVIDHCQMVSAIRLDLGFDP